MGRVDRVDVAIVVEDSRWSCVLLNSYCHQVVLTRVVKQKSTDTLGLVNVLHLKVLNPYLR